VSRDGSVPAPRQQEADPEVVDGIERWSEVGATRVRRLTSATLVAGGVLSALVVSSEEGPLVLAIAIVSWIVAISGTIWLFRHRRRSPL
jgi:hypothetical protein